MHVTELLYHKHLCTVTFQILRTASIIGAIFHRPDDWGSTHVWNVGLQETTRRNILKGSDLHTLRRENLKRHRCIPMFRWSINCLWLIWKSVEYYIRRRTMCYLIAARKLIQFRRLALFLPRVHLALLQRSAYRPPVRCLFRPYAWHSCRTNCSMDTANCYCIRKRKLCSFEWKLSLVLN
jgi:hypothetical protein